MAQSIDPADIKAQMSRRCGLVVSYMTGLGAPDEDGPITIGMPLDAVKLTASEWKPLPTVNRLGVPLLYATPKEDKNPLSSMLQLQGRNETLEILTTECDPESEQFGEPAMGDEEAKAAVMFKFEDEEKVVVQGHLGWLAQFIEARLLLIKTALASEGGLEKAKEEYEKMCPTEFKLFFKKQKVEAVREGLKWGDVFDPVELDKPACEGCCAEGGELSKCGRCKKVLYCGRECQKADWNAHKPFCSRR